MNTEEIVKEYIDKTVHMSMATSKDNKPWVCEVHFGYDENLNLYFVSRLDTRHCQEIAANPAVAGNIVKQHGLTEIPHGIYFEGTAELVEVPSPEQITLYCSRLGRDEAEVNEFLAGGGKGMFKITVKNWAAFGKFDTDTVEKHELSWNGGKK